MSYISEYIPLSDRIVLTSLLTCAATKFEESEFEITYVDIFTEDTDEIEYPDHFSRELHDEKKSSTTENKAFKTTKKPDKLILMGKELSMDDVHFSWSVDEAGDLWVCVDTLQKLWPGQEGKARKDSVLWLYVLSMTAIPLSIVCLAAVLVVYGLLPTLRTQPGLNTMATCLSLLLAQLWLLLASHRLLHGAWCLALGVLLHLAWLTAFCWTSVCSIHMYSAFSSNTQRRSGPGSYRVLAKNAAGTLLIPGAIVAMVMAVSWYRSDGQSIGYSGESCYLSSTILVIFAVILPLSVLVVLNLLLYLLTIYRIHKVRTLQARAREDGSRQYFTACLRLSLLTGTTWVLSLLSEGLDLDWLRAVSILVNGGQGALLLVSFVTTRRVAAMMAASFRCCRREQINTMTTG